MILDDVLARLADLSSPDLLARNATNGAGSVPMGDIRTLAKAIKTDHALGLQLWATGNVDARLVAILILKPKSLTPEEVEAMIRSNDRLWVSDWLNNYILKQHPAKEALRLKWEREGHPFLARAHWSLTSERVQKSPAGLDLAALLDRIGAEMPKAAEPAQWTMNFTLGHIAIHHPAFRDRAVALAEEMGIYRDYPTPKGCTSPFVPLWVAEMVRRGA